MASTITAASATVTINESIFLNGKDQGGSHTRTIANINESDRRIMTVPTASEINLIELNTDNGQGKFVGSAIKYIRITNLDDTNFVRIRISDGGTHVADIKVAAGATFMLSTDKIHTGAGAFASFVDMTQIAAQADTAACDIEYCVLSV